MYTGDFQTLHRNRFCCQEALTALIIYLFHFFMELNQGGKNHEIIFRNGMGFNFFCLKKELPTDFVFVLSKKNTQL